MSIEVSSAAVPHVLWQYYLQYLWHFSPDSWVAKVAYTFRVLAIILILPLLILALLVCFPVSIDFQSTLDIENRISQRMGLPELWASSTM